MLTFHHSFSTRIFLAPATETRSLNRSVILSGAKDPRKGRELTWLLRGVREEQFREATPAAAARQGGGHAR
jgi:hypothetical protein